MNTLLRHLEGSTPTRRAVRWAANGALTLVVGAAAAFGASLIARAADGGSPPPPAQSGIPCDPDGVSVGYDVTYAASLASYAVSGLRVVGIASGCAGSTIQVAMADGAGTALPNGTVAAVVDGPSVHKQLVGLVSAAAVQRVYVSLEGHTEVLEPPVVAPPPATTAVTTTTPAPQPLLPVAPSLCPTVSGALSVVGVPQECGAVAAAPSVNQAAQQPTPVASWPAQVFPEKVKVTLEPPAPTALKTPSISAGATIVQLTVVRASTGEEVTSWNGVMAIDFPAQSGPFLAAYSHDGSTWATIPQLDGPELPAGQSDGYYVHGDRSVTVYTRHATFFALAPPPQRVTTVHAKLLPSGAVRVTWTPSVAGLGVDAYWVVRNGKVAAKVTGTHTSALLRELRPARLSLAIIAVDPIGTRSDTSPGVRIRVPLLVGAQLRSRPPGLRAAVRVLAPARLRVLVLAADGRRLTLLPGSTVGGTRVRGRTTQVAVGPQRGAVALALRLDRAQLARGARYRVVVLAQPLGGAADRAELRFRG